MTQELITMTGKYKYRNGEPARVICVDGYEKNLPVISMTEDGEILTHDLYGKFTNEDNIDALDLIPYVPLWEGEIWLNPDGKFFSDARPEDSPDWQNNITQKGYRKIKVREIEQ